MKTNFLRVTGAIVLITILSCSFVGNIPVLASTPGDGQWSPQDIPSITKNIILNGSGIIDIATGPDSKTVYAADTLAGSFIMKSTDGGQSFDSVQNNYATVGGATPVAISVAPDDANTLAVTDGTRVVLSKDGGTTWSLLPNPALGAGVITDIAVAPARSGTLLGREYFISIADGTPGVAAGDAQIIGNTAVWATIGGAGANAIAGIFDFTSVAVTPTFLGDRCIVALGTRVAAGTTTVLVINTATNTIVNNAGAGIVLLATGTTTEFLTVPVATSIVKSSIALPSNFDATTSSGRRCYVGIAAQSTYSDNDVYRVDNDAAKALAAITGPVNSVAYSGTIDAGTLFMGPRNNVDVKYTTQMTGTSPVWTTTLKGPAGQVVVPAVQLATVFDYAVSKTVFAGTVGAESAFSISTDAGVSFNGESLVNTGAANIGSIRGMTFTTDARTAFLNTRDSNNYISIWQSGLPLSSTSWSRILTKPLVNVGPASGCSLKLNPVPIPPLSLFFMETTTVNGPIYVSADGGVSFSTRSGPSGVGLKTLSVRDSQTLYYVDAAANVYKSNNAGWTWGTAVATGVVGTATQGYRIILPRANQLIVGGATVAISNDDAASFTLMNSGLPAAVPNVFPLSAGTGYILSTDTKYAENNIIYAADTGLTGSYNIYRIRTANTGNNWENLGITVVSPPAGRIVEMTARSGILYAMTNQIGAAGGSLRTLYPTELAGNQNWQTLSASLSASLGSLGAAPGIILYAGDTAGTAIYAFNDYLAATKPTLTNPDDNFNDPVNPSGGNGYSIDFKWKPMGTGTGQVDRVDIEIVDKSNGFTGTPTIPLQPVAPTNPVYTTAFTFQPNKTYQWRVRAARTTSGQLVDSPWSDPRTINIQAGGNVQQSQVGPILQGPQIGAQNINPASVGFSWTPIPGATEYQIIIATDPGLTKTVSGTPATVTIPAYQATGLDFSTVYYWAVVATKPTQSVQSVGTFTTMAKPAAPPAIAQPPIVDKIPSTATNEIPVHILVVIAIGIILVIAVIILIVKTRNSN